MQRDEPMPWEEKEEGQDSPMADVVGPVLGPQTERRRPSLTDTTVPATAMSGEEHAAVLDELLYRYLLPNFDLRRGGATSRTRMTWAFRQRRKYRQQFRNLYRYRHDLRPFLRDPRTRLALYRVWIARPLQSLWNFAVYDYQTHVPIDQVRKHVSFPSDEEWRLPITQEPDRPAVRPPPLNEWGEPVYPIVRDAQGRPVMPSKKQVKAFDYRLRLGWYDTFLNEAYANHHLEFVARAAARLNLLPVNTITDLLDKVNISVPKIPQADAVLAQAVIDKSYYDLMRSVYYRDDEEGMGMAVDLADKMGLVAPGVGEILTTDQWRMELMDRVNGVEFPGSSLLTLEWNHPDLQRLIWIKQILMSVRAALASTTVIRVPTFAAYELIHKCRTQILFAPVPSDFITSPNTRAGVSILARADAGAPRRRWLYFNPPVYSAPVWYMTQLQEGLQLMLDRYKDRAEYVKDRMEFFLHILRDTYFHLGAVSCRPEKSLLLKNIRLMSLVNTSRTISPLYDSAKPPPQVLSTVFANEKLVQYHSMYLVFASVTVQWKPLTAMEKRLAPSLRRTPRTIRDPMDNPYVAYMETIRPTHLTLQVNLDPDERNLLPFQERIRSTIWYQNRVGGGRELVEGESYLQDWIHVVGTIKNRYGQVVRGLVFNMRPLARAPTEFPDPDA